MSRGRTILGTSIALFIAIAGIAAGFAVIGRAAAPNLPDLSITKTPHDTPWAVGDTKTFSIDIQNLGPGKVFAGEVVRVTDSLPGELSYVSATGTGWSCTSAIQCDYLVPAGDFNAPNNLPTITITVKVTSAPSSGTTKNCGDVVALEGGKPIPENDKSNDESCVFIPISAPAADIAITKTPLNPPWTVGSPEQFTLVVKNNGPASLPSAGGTVITVNEVVPAGSTVTAEPGSPWSCSPAPNVVGPATITCTLTLQSDLGAGQSLPTMTFGAVVNQAPEGSVHNCANVAASNPFFGLPSDNNPNDNSSCVDVPVMTLGTVCVLKFSDLNGDGVKGKGEPFLPSWSHPFVIRDSTGKVVATISSLQAEHGCVQLPAGQYTVEEVPPLPAGWVQTAPPPPGTVTVVAGKTTTVTFGNHQFQLDHFECYVITPTNFSVPNVGLLDQFGKRSAYVTSRRRLCNPVSKNKEKELHPNLHLTCYGLTHVPAKSPTTVSTTDQFGTDILRVKEPPNLLCLPTSKTKFPKQKLQPPGPGLDHFLCYDVVPIKTPAYPSVALDDQFWNTPAKVVRPIRLCNPVEKTVKGKTTTRAHPADHLVCYLIDPKKQFTPLSVWIRNQFEPYKQLKIVKWETLCVPAVKRVIGPTTSGGKGTLCIQLFDDRNSDGRREKGEEFLSGWQVRVRRLGGGPTSSYRTRGSMLFVKVDPGQYEITETVKQGWMATHGSQQTARVDSGQTVDVLLGNRKG